MDTKPVNDKKNPRRVSVGARYREDRKALLELVKVRRGYPHLADVVEEALDRLLSEEGLLGLAA